MLSRVLPLLACLTAASCGVVDFDKAPVGRFNGSLLVMWVGEGDALGDGRFVYVPSPTRPLTFRRENPDATVSVIKPEMMYTDGGSIPKPGQLFNGFAPWGYAPAYMVHDWIFVARHCLTDGTPTEAEKEIARMEFQESAEVIAEAIKTLIDAGKVTVNDVAPRVISGVVAGPFSYDRWVVKGACTEDRVSEAHRKEVEEALALRRGFARSRRAAPTAQIVAEVSF